ncbi:MAG TPA: YceI family protein [Cyclobacteriaceae bacterium]|nr:YceI family protein [Cyclobacteriaceae bacterium]
MKYSLVIIGFLFAAASPAPRNTERWVVSAQSELIIRGTTNVNDFVCRTGFNDVRDTLELLLANKDCPIIFSRNAMIIPVASFDCGNQMITKDFQETLSANRYPELTLRFVSIEEQVPGVASGSVAGVVEITLTGTTRSYSVLYSLAGNGDRSVSLVGKQDVCFSDFNLNAPRKMMGLIKVQDDLEVEFRLHLQKL